MIGMARPTLLAAVLLLAAATVSRGADAPAPFEGKRSLYHGYTRYDFALADGTPAIVVVPKETMAGRPWVWRAEFFDHRPEVDLALVAKGFHLVHLKVGNTFGCPSAMDKFDAFYALLTTKHGLSPRPVLEGLSRGGLYVYNWAARDPKRVGAILGDNPVCDFKSWPGGKGKGPGSKNDWAKLQQDYGFQSEAEAVAYDKNPVDNLKGLAAAKIPILHLADDADEVVPYAENTLLLKQRYEALDGPIHVIVKPGMKHHPHGLDDPTPAVEWVLKNAIGLGRPA